MTTMFQKEVECCICGEKSNHMEVGSTNSIGSPDLDTRPPEMERSTIYHLIQRCPSCGYCSTLLSECGNKTKEVVKSKEYQSILARTDIPEVASSFLALSYDQEKHQKYSDAAWSVIYAAWVCDDGPNHEAAVKSRKKAVELIESANLNGQRLSDQIGASEAITVDLLRRSGMHQEALELCLAAKTLDVSEIIGKIIQYQELLITRSDSTAHTMARALSRKR